MWYKRGVPNSSVLLHPTDNVQDHFSLGKELGTGFSGVVRQCTDRNTGEQLACKSIRKANLEDEDDFDDVRLEVAVMRRLNGHPNVVGLRGVFEDAENVHIIMELCEGGDLFDEVVKRGPFSEMGAAHIVAQIAESVACCHAKGVMHRDLKPENILLVSPSSRKNNSSNNRQKMDSTSPPPPPTDTDKNDTNSAKSHKSDAPITPKTSSADVSNSSSSPSELCTVKLADFGLAMFLGPFQEASGFAGSPYYVAPEVLSQTWYGREADIWSLGVVLYVMLSGEFPFAGKTDAKLYKAIKRGKLTFAHTPWPSVSVLAKSLIRSMLSLDPRARPTATEILQHPWIRNSYSTAPYSPYKKGAEGFFAPGSVTDPLSLSLSPPDYDYSTSPSPPLASKGSAISYFTATLGSLLLPPSPPSPPPYVPRVTSPAAPRVSMPGTESESESESVQKKTKESVSPCTDKADTSEFDLSVQSVQTVQSVLPGIMCPPKVHSAPKDSLSFLKLRAGSPKSVLGGVYGEEISDTDSDGGGGGVGGAEMDDVEEDKNQKLTNEKKAKVSSASPSPPSLTSPPPSLLGGVIGACLWRVSAAATCYSGAILGRCLSRRRPEGGREREREAVSS